MQSVVLSTWVNCTTGHVTPNIYLILDATFWKRSLEYISPSHWLANKGRRHELLSPTITELLIREIKMSHRLKFGGADLPDIYCPHSVRKGTCANKKNRYDNIDILLISYEVLSRNQSCFNLIIVTFEGSSGEPLCFSRIAITYTTINLTNLILTYGVQVNTFAAKLVSGCKLNSIKVYAN